jgi:lysophospholipase L1-like esterase
VIGRILARLAAGLIILGLAAISLYLFHRADRYYRALNAVRLDPLGLNADFGPLPSPEPDRMRVVFLGDSRAQDWPAPDLPGYTFLNRGIGSQTSAQVALRFDAHIRPLQPDVVVVQVCVNDLKTIPLFPQQADAIVDDCLRHLETILTGARDLGVQVILTTVFPVGEVPLERRLVWSDAVTHAIQRVNERIRTLAAADVTVLDAYALLADARGLLRADLALDELHLNAAGYAVLNRELHTLLGAQQ